MTRRRRTWLLSSLLVGMVACGEDAGPELASPSTSTTSPSTTVAGDARDGGEEPPGSDVPPEAEADWVSFEPPGGGFRVELPAEPRRSEQSMPSEIGPLQAVFFSVELGPDAGINIAYTDYPEAVLEVEPSRLLDEVVQGATTNVSGTVESSEQLTVDGNPAVDYVIAVSGGTFQTRSILVGRRLYGLQRGGAEPDEATFRRLVESFELVGG